MVVHCWEVCVCVWVFVCVCVDEFLIAQKP